MGEGFRATEHVAGSIEEVWGCLTDWKRADSGQVAALKRLVESPSGPGTRTPPDDARATT